MDDHGLRPLRLPRRGRLHDHAIRPFPGDGPCLALQPGGVAHPPAPRLLRKQLEAVGPPGGMARAGTNRWAGLQVRVGRGHGTSHRHPHRGSHYERKKGWPVLHRQ